MPVGLPHERVGDFMQERVVNLLVCSRPGIGVGEGDDPRVVVATPCALGGVVKLETPALKLVRHEPRAGARRYGLEVAVRALACAPRRVCLRLL